MARRPRNPQTDGPVQRNPGGGLPILPVLLVGAVVLLVLYSGETARWWDAVRQWLADTLPQDVEALLPAAVQDIGDWFHEQTDRASAHSSQARGGPAPQRTWQIPTDHPAPAQARHPGWVVSSHPATAGQPLVIGGWQARRARLPVEERRVDLAPSHPECRLKPGSYPPRGKVFYGTLDLAGRRHCLAVTGWGEHIWLWFDKNADGRFGDAGGIYNGTSGTRLSVTARLPMPERRLRPFPPQNRTYEVHFRIRDDGEGNPLLTYRPATELTARTALPGRTGRVEAVVSERRQGRDGDFSDDGVFIDFDADGRFEAGEYLPPGRAVTAPDGVLWRPRVALDRASSVPEKAARRHRPAPKARDLLARAAAEPSPCPQLLQNLKQELDGDRTRLDELLRELLQCQWRRPSYREAKDTLVLWRYHQAAPWPEAKAAGRVILALARQTRPPVTAKVRRVPRITPPDIDGRLSDGEWDRALVLTDPGTRTRLFAGTDGTFLYLGADVPENTSPHDWDSMKVSLNAHVSPHLRGEYFFIYGGRGGHGSLIYRRTNLRLADAPATAEELPSRRRWRAYPITDEIGPAPRSASVLDGHRQYETAIPLEAAHIPTGAAFSLGVELEVAPKTRHNAKTGKDEFVQRRYVGPFRPDYRKHSSHWEVWLRILPARISHQGGGRPRQGEYVESSRDTPTTHCFQILFTPAVRRLGEICGVAYAER